uniref:La-kappaKTx3 n=1 Tax=Liocheles australasiae TaxID=431266 RepID=KKX53_LIOAU
MKLLPLLVILIICALMANEAFCDQGARERSENLEDTRDLVQKPCRIVCSENMRKCIRRCTLGR